MATGLYVHIPYCRRKCLYCDFFSGGARQASWQGLADALSGEFAARREELSEPLGTFYLGGGTPSMMPVNELERLIGMLRATAGELWQPQESTIELNPDDVSGEYIDCLLQLGFDRFSLGVQILDDDLLARIGRRHDTDTARRAMGILRSRGVNMSVDLMFGLPGMTTDVWRRSVEEVATLRPDHISAYALMYEPGTALTVLRDAGRIRSASDEEYELQYTLLTTHLSDAGYEHYETSNYALPGRESLHNTSYWLGAPYIGLGPGAHSYNGRRLRRANLPDLKGYVAGEMPHEDEWLSDEMLCDEYLLTRLRLLRGFTTSDFAARFGEEAHARLLRAARRMPGLTVAEGRIALTHDYLLIADEVIASLAAAF